MSRLKHFQKKGWSSDIYVDKRWSSYQNVGSAFKNGSDGKGTCDRVENVQLSTKRFSRTQVYQDLRKLDKGFQLLVAFPNPSCKKFLVKDHSGEGIFALPSCQVRVVNNMSHRDFGKILLLHCLIPDPEKCKKALSQKSFGKKIRSFMALWSRISLVMRISWRNLRERDLILYVFFPKSSYQEVMMQRFGEISEQNKHETENSTKFIREGNKFNFQIAIRPQPTVV